MCKAYKALNLAKYKTFSKLIILDIWVEYKLKFVDWTLCQLTYFKYYFA